MSKNFWKIRNEYANIYKLFLFLVSIFLLVSLFPREGTFKYEFRKGKYWMHEDLIAPFDFAITKSDEEITSEKTALLSNIKPYFRMDTVLNLQKRNEFKSLFNKKWDEKYALVKNETNKKREIVSSILSIYDSLINTGVIEIVPEIENKPVDFSIALIKNNIAEEKEISKFTLLA